MGMQVGVDDGGMRRKCAAGRGVGIEAGRQGKTATRTKSFVDRGFAHA